jgi:acyl carrier protein
MSRFDRIVHYIRENMEPEFDPGEDALSQVLDSVSLLQLITFIDQDLGIPLDLEGLTLDRFASVESVVQMLSEYGRESHTH